MRAYSTTARSISSLTDVARSHSAKLLTASFQAWEDRTIVAASRTRSGCGLRPAPARLPPRAGSLFSGDFGMDCNRVMRMPRGTAPAPNESNALGDILYQRFITGK